MRQHDTQPPGAGAAPKVGAGAAPKPPGAGAAPNPPPPNPPGAGAGVPKVPTFRVVDDAIQNKKERRMKNDGMRKTS